MRPCAHGSRDEGKSTAAAVTPNNAAVSIRLVLRLFEMLLTNSAYTQVAENGRLLFQTAPAPGQLRRPVLLAPFIDCSIFFFLDSTVPFF